MLAFILTYIVPPLVKLVILLGFAIALAAVLTWMERRQSAMMQDRIGPERAYLLPPRPGRLLGRLRLWGLVHPLADALKLATKEDFVPPRAHRALFALAPVLTIVPVLLVFAVIPFGPPVCLDQLGAINPDPSRCKHVEFLQVAHIDVGLLFVFAVASIATYGAALAGWASNSAYGLLGGMRATAQMFSYEITMGMTVMGAFLVYGTLEPMALVERQASLSQWGIATQPLGFILFMAAAIAETKRAPFDLPEGESEILGYFVEYSGARFMIFYLAEFVEIVFAACMVVTIFLGGWQAPGLPIASMPHWLAVLVQMGAFMVKVFVICFLQLAIRWSVPRMRYDQLMALGWKGLLPASLANVVITAGLVLWSQGA
jgi:NADH-quinone oxidoreductase subunit H